MNLRSRSESGSSLLSVIIGMALSVVVLGGFTAFYMTANASAHQAAVAASSQSDLVQAANRIGRDIADASRVVMVAPGDLVVDTGYGLIRWSVDGGELATQAGSYDADWDTVPSRVTARGIKPTVFEAGEGGRLVNISLVSTDGQREISTAASALR